MQSDLGELLRRIVRDPSLHGRWLNTFSFLEYVGYRKIVKSQKAETLTLATLRHAAEEGRHAILLKKFALEIGGVGLDSYAPAAMLCGKGAEAYFQSLDQACEDALRAAFSGGMLARITYLYVTRLVEERALLVYGQYRQELAHFGLELPLQGLLSEEAKHLELVRREIAAADPAFPDRFPELQRTENRLYEAYLAALSAELSVSVSHVASV